MSMPLRHCPIGQPRGLIGEPAPATTSPNAHPCYVPFARPIEKIPKTMRMPSSPLGHHFYTMACNNAWANHRLLNACARLSPADFIAPRTSFFPSIKATLNHIVTVDWYYVDALEHALQGDAPNTDVDRFFDP